MLNETAYLLGSHRSCIRDLFEYGRQRTLEVGAENVYDYSLGNPSIPAPTQVNAAIRQLLEDTDSLQLHGYTSAAGDLSVRQAVAEDLNTRFSASAQPEDLFITCGAAPALTAVCKALTFPGAKILAFAPYFPEYRPFVEVAGAQFEVVEANAPSFQISPQTLEARLSPDVTAVIVNSPNNPSGVV